MLTQELDIAEAEAALNEALNEAIKRVDALGRTKWWGLEDREHELMAALDDNVVVWVFRLNKNGTHPGYPKGLRQNEPFGVARWGDLVVFSQMAD